MSKKGLYIGAYVYFDQLICQLRSIGLLSTDYKCRPVAGGGAVSPPPPPPNWQMSTFLAEIKKKICRKKTQQSNKTAWEQHVGPNDVASIHAALHSMQCVS